MTEQRTPEEALLLAALRVIECLSPSNYRGLRQPSTTYSSQISREALADLADAIDAVRPGVIDRMYEIIERRART